MDPGHEARDDASATALGFVVHALGIVGRRHAPLLLELDDAAGNEGARDEGAGNESLVVVIVVAAGAVLAAGVVVVVVRGGRAKQRAEAERAAARSRDGVDS